MMFAAYLGLLGCWLIFSSAGPLVAEDAVHSFLERRRSA